MKTLILAVLLLLSPAAWAAGTCTVTNVTSTQNANSRVFDPGVVIVTLTCTADASAHTFPVTTVPLYTTGSLLNAYNLTGFVLYQVGRTPGATQPTANYTTTITDAQGFAIDLGLLTTNGSASSAQLTPIAASASPASFPTIRSALTVAITANSVNSAQITLDLIFKAII